MGGLELALQTEAGPLVRFFIGFFTVLVITGSTVLIAYWLSQGE